jgi:hypothetical protein
MMGNTFSVLGKDLPSYLVLFLILSAITTGLNAAVTYAAFGVFSPGLGFGAAPPSMASLVTYFILLPVVALATTLIGALFVGTASYMAVRRHRGQPVPLGEAFGHAAHRLPSLLGATLVQSTLPLGLLLIPVALLLAATASLVPGTLPDPSFLGLVLGACGLLLLLVPLALFLAIKFALAIPAVVAEGKGALEALRHSWRLMTGHWWTYFLAAIVIGFLAIVISAAIAIPADLSGNAAIVIFGEVLGGALAGPWGVILSAVAFSLIVRERSLFAPPGYGIPVQMGTPGQPPPGR